MVKKIDIDGKEVAFRASAACISAISDCLNREPDTGDIPIEKEGVSFLYHDEDSCKRIYEKVVENRKKHIRRREQEKDFSSRTFP